MNAYLSLKLLNYKTYLKKRQFIMLTVMKKNMYFSYHKLINIQMIVFLNVQNLKKIFNFDKKKEGFLDDHKINYIKKVSKNNYFSEMYLFYISIKAKKICF